MSVEDAARAEAKHRWPKGSPGPLHRFRGVFVRGAMWGAAWQAAQAPTAPTTEQIAAVLREHHRDGRKSWAGTTWCTCGLRNIGDWHATHQAEQVAALFHPETETTTEGT